MTALKLRSKVNFPATVTATGGLAVSKSNGVWTVEPDWSYLSLETSIPDALGRQLWTYDPTADSYYRLSVQALIDNLPAGPPGDDGAAATITAGSTSTGNAGTSASASNSGTSSAAIFDFSIPRGADAGMRYAFETSTSMAAPASGGIRLNNASLASVTAIAVNATEAGGVDVSDFIATWDDSTNTVKGYVEVRKEGSGAVLGLYSITSVTDNTTWLQIAVAYVSGSGSFSASDPVYLIPYLTGNKGSDGSGSPANPTATIGLSAVNGVATTYIRSDGAPALDQSIAPTWTGTHKFTNAPVPTTNDSTALGTTALQWSDLFLASGAVVNYANGNFTITHSSGALTMSGTLSLGTSNAFTCGTIELGAASDTTISRSAAGVIAVEGVPLYSNIPQNSQSAAYTLVLADAQKHILHPSADTTARVFTIPANSSVAFPIGTAVTFVNQNAGGVITISITTDTMRLAGAGTTGSRTLAANGIATALKITSTEWIISGTGLT